MTQCDKLLEALQRGEVITPLRALELAGSLRCSERVRELEAQGVPIIHEWQQVGDKRVMGYRLGGIAHG